MKIALCISGSLRNFKDTYYSFKEYLLKHHNVDVFFYGLENKENKEKNKIDLYNLYAPKLCVVNNNKWYEQLNISKKYYFSNVANSMYAFFNIYKCNELKKEYEIKNNFVYDLVLRCRTDYFWFRSLTDQELNLAKSNVLTPEEWSFKGVNSFARSDVFAIGNSKLMDQYSSMFNFIEEYTKKIQYHPESICGYHLMTNSIPNIEVKRCVVFEYPCKQLEKYIFPYKHFKYFEVPDIKNEDELGYLLCNKRKEF